MAFGKNADTGKQMEDSSDELTKEKVAQSPADEGNVDAEQKFPGETAGQETLDEIKVQAENYLNNWQRLQAEFDNYRKRTQREKEEYIKYASEQVVKGLLPVLDNFERALAAAKVKQDFAGFVQGVDMIFRQLSDILTKEGLAPIEAVGQMFDPNFHEAILQVEGPHPENTVVEEVQKGYLLKEKVIRPSMVKVSC